LTAKTASLSKRRAIRKKSDKTTDQSFKKKPFLWFSR